MTRSLRFVHFITPLRKREIRRDEVLGNYYTMIVESALMVYFCGMFISDLVFSKSVRTSVGLLGLIQVMDGMV